MTDFEKMFDEYFFEFECFALRAERFYNDLSKSDPVLMQKWLKAAFVAGADAATKNKNTITISEEEYFRKMGLL